MKLTNRYKERFLRKIKVFQGNAVGFRVDKIALPNGKSARRAYLTHPGAVGVLVIDSEGKFILVKQYRYPVHEFTYEIPAGKLAARENPLTCVRRELEEETGARAKKIQKLLTFWPTAAFSDERIHIYLASDLTFIDAHPDEDEYLELVRFTPSQLERMIRRGDIRDSKTMIAYLAWKTLPLTG